MARGTAFLTAIMLNLVTAASGCSQEALFKKSSKKVIH